MPIECDVCCECGCDNADHAEMQRLLLRAQAVESAARVLLALLDRVDVRVEVDERVRGLEAQFSHAVGTLRTLAKGPACEP